MERRKGSLTLNLSHNIKKQGVTLQTTDLYGYPGLSTIISLCTNVPIFPLDEDIRLSGGK